MVLVNVTAVAFFIRNHTPNIPALCLKYPEIRFDLQSRKISESNKHILKDDYIKLHTRYKNYHKFIQMG